MSTSQTHFSWKGQWLAVKEKATVTSPWQQLFPLWSLESTPFSCHDFHKRDCEFLPLPFSTEVEEKFLHSTKIGLSIWGFAILTFPAGPHLPSPVLPWPLSQRLPAFVFSGIAMLAPLEKSPVNIFLSNMEDFQKSKIQNCCCFSLSKCFALPHVFHFFP